jgi:segregation and condensation protein B
MNDQYLKNVIEAALLAGGRPLRADELRELFDEFDRPELEAIEAAVAALAAEYDGRGLEVKEVASGWRIQVRESVAAPVSRLWQERPAKYSRAFLETLALIAYRQPITRGEIEEIRGVAVNPNIVKTLMERGWVRVVGHREVPGRPEVLGTTREFLDYFGLRSLDDLPTLAQLRDIETLGVQLEFPGTQPSPAAADVQGAADAGAESGATEAAASAEAATEAAAFSEESGEQVLESAPAAAASEPEDGDVPAVAATVDDADLDVETSRAPAEDAIGDAGDAGEPDDEHEGEVRAAGLVAADGEAAAVREPRD